MARKAKKRRYSRSASSDVESEMRRYKKGTAKSGRGGKGRDGGVSSQQTLCGGDRIRTIGPRVIYAFGIGSGRFTRASGKVGVNENDGSRRSRGTDGSNPASSSGESANHRFRCVSRS